MLFESLELRCQSPDWVHNLLSQPLAEERNAITINTNDVSGRSTPSAVSYDGKLRHVGAAWLTAEVAMSLKLLGFRMEN